MTLEEFILNESQNYDTKKAINYIKSKHPKTKDDISTFFHDYLQSIQYKFSSYEDFEYEISNIMNKFSKNIDMREKMPISQFKKTYHKNPKINSEFTVHMGAPGYGKITYKITDIDENDVYYIVSSDTSGILSPSDVI